MVRWTRSRVTSLLVCKRVLEGRNTLANSFEWTPHTTSTLIHFAGQWKSSIVLACHCCVLTVSSGPPSAISSIATVSTPPVMYCRASTLKIFVLLRDEFMNTVEFFNASWIDVSAVYNEHTLQGLVYDASEDVGISTHVVGLIPLLGQGNYTVSVTVEGAAVSVNPPVPFVWEGTWSGAVACARKGRKHPLVCASSNAHCCSGVGQRPR